MMEMVDVNKNDSGNIKYIIKFLRKDKMLVTNDLLKSKNVPDIGSIEISLYEYINESNNLKQEQIENIMFTEVLSSLHQEFKSRYYNLSHLNPKSMFRLERLGVLLSIFIDLKDDVPICASCMIGAANRRKRRKKEINRGSQSHKNYTDIKSIHKTNSGDNHIKLRL